MSQQPRFKCDLNDLRLEDKSLTVEILIRKCLTILVNPVQSEAGDPLILAFLLLHEWYIDSSQLIGSLLKCLQENNSLWPGVVQMLDLWQSVYPQAFTEDKLQATKALVELKSWALVNVANFDAQNFPYAQHGSDRCSRFPSVKQSTSCNVSLSFDQWSPEDLAVNLTHIESTLLKRISFREYKQYALCSQLNNVPCLRKSIAMFNSISQWIQCMILNKTTASDRAQVINKFVKVARVLKELQNFNTLMAVVGALTHSVIARLSRTMVSVPNYIRLELLTFSNFLSSAGNFSVYRKVLYMSSGFRLPIIGVHLKDLMSLHVALPDYLDDGQLNCQKLTHLASIFSHLVYDVQQMHLPLEVNENLLSTLKVALSVDYNDEEIYYLSLKREPKTLLKPALQSSPVLADWAAGVQNQVDSAAMQKHVNAMVEAIFRHYDLNHDGYISKQEFDLIRTNFPLFDRFVALDTNRDGRISKGEMKMYFMHLRKNQKGDVNHHFRMTNTLAPCFCFHCKRLVWNLLRPELKCDNCGIVIHRNCEESHSSTCVKRRRNTEPTHRRGAARRHLSTNRQLEKNSVDEEQSQITSSNESDQKQEERRPKSIVEMRKEAFEKENPKLRSYSEGGPCYKALCQSMATLACEELFESD